MSTSALLVFMCLIGCLVVEAKVFTRCEFAKELTKFKDIPKWDIKDYVCIAEWESSYNSRAKNTINTDGSYDYGIFQINNRYWCQDPHKASSNMCGLSCQSLVDDNITNDIKCAITVRKKQGFSAWVAWNNRCRGRDLSEYVRGCGI